MRECLFTIGQSQNGKFIFVYSTLHIFVVLRNTNVEVLMQISVLFQKGVTMSVRTLALTSQPILMKFRMSQYFGQLSKRLFRLKC